MKSPPAKKLQQLSLSEQERSRSQRQKRDRHGRTSIRDLRSVMIAGAVKKASAREAKFVYTETNRNGFILHLHTYLPNEMESFEREYKVMSTISKIPGLARYVPQLAKVDHDSRTLVLSTPEVLWFHLLTHVEAESTSLDQILEFKQRLRSHVELLYSHGVAYPVKYDFIRLAKSFTGRWRLYWHGWLNADLCDDPSQLESAEWKEREAEQLNELERIFDLLVKRYEDIQDIRVHGKEAQLRVEQWTLRDQLRGQTS